MGTDRLEPRFGARNSVGIWYVPEGVGGVDGDDLLLGHLLSFEGEIFVDMGDVVVPTAP